MKKNVAGQKIGAQMIDASDGSDFEGTVTVYTNGDSDSQTLGSTGSGICTHEGNGFHSYEPSQAETDYDHASFTFTGSGAITATIQVYPIDQPTIAQEHADVLLDRDMAEGDDNSSDLIRTVRSALRVLRNKWGISGTTLTRYKEDDSTVNFTEELTTGAASPVTGSTPG